MTAIAELRQLISLASRFDAAHRGAAGLDSAELDVVLRDARAVIADTRVPEQDSPFDAARMAHVATAHAVVAIAAAPADDPDAEYDSTELRTVAARIWAGLRTVPRRVGGEIRHIMADRPHSTLLRLVITLGISLGLVKFYEFSGWSNYTAAQLMLYFYSAVVGSVVCTNALCFEADRTRLLAQSGEPVWRILAIKNVAMAVLILLTGVPAIALLAAGPSHLLVVPLVDQFLVMIFIWLGIANVLSVIAPLRHEPMSARLRDGTWLPFLLSFAISYGVGLTVNLMIFWRLWARQAASDHVTGGAVVAFVLVLASSVLLWWLLTVFAASSVRNQLIRRALDREMVAYAGPRSTS